MFYNCISLSSIPDFKERKLSRDNNYLMFYNCISLAYLPYKDDIIKFDKNGFLVLIIIKSFKIKMKKQLKILLKVKKEK